MQFWAVVAGGGVCLFTSFNTVHGTDQLSTMVQTEDNQYGWGTGADLWRKVEGARLTQLSGGLWGM